MSKRYIGGLITKSPTVPTTSAAPGIWTLDQALYYIKAGTWPQPPTYIEDVFSTYLYTGNGSTGQTIANGIDLAGKGGMVWIKSRSVAANHWIVDTNRGSTKGIKSNTTGAQQTSAAGTDVASFLSNGFSLGADNQEQVNTSGATFASWTFRKAPKFFDVVTYTGNGAYGRSISHSLGIAPGFIIVKRLDASSDWKIYHRGVSMGYGLLNTTDAVSATSTTLLNGYVSSADASTFNVTQYITSDAVNASGATYVAYLFAHDATADGIIQCGSYTGNGSTSGPTVTLGWEPQYIMIKNASGTGDWQIVDNMRGMPVGATDATLQANLTNAESSVDYVSPAATGFQVTSGSAEVNASASTYIYIAIRRGPMKTPTVGTSVFMPILRAGTGTNTTIDVGFTVDTHISTISTGGGDKAFFDRLRAPLYLLRSNSNGAQAFGNASLTNFANNTGVGVGADNFALVINYSSYSFINWVFRRAPGFFDVVCYTGTGVANQRINHSLGVAPELIIQKTRSAASSWFVYTASAGIGAYNRLNTNVAQNTSANFWGSSAPTTTDFGFNNVDSGISSGTTCVTYLFASCPGVSKVGSYTGTGTTQTINCGFTTGARFVLIKRTDSTGDWYVWDSARGIVAGNDPYLLLNSTAAEVTSTDYIDTDNSGFQISSTAPAAINANGGTFIYLAIS